MAIPLDPEQIVSFEELLMSQVAARSLYQVVYGKGIFTKEEFLEMVRVVNKEMRKGGF